MTAENDWPAPASNLLLILISLLARPNFATLEEDLLGEHSENQAADEATEALSHPQAIVF